MPLRKLFLPIFYCAWFLYSISYNYYSIFSDKKIFMGISLILGMIAVFVLVILYIITTIRKKQVKERNKERMQQQNTTHTQ